MNNPEVFFFVGGGTICGSSGGASGYASEESKFESRIVKSRIILHYLNPIPEKLLCPGCFGCPRVPSNLFLVTVGIEDDG